MEALMGHEAEKPCSASVARLSSKIVYKTASGGWQLEIYVHEVGNE